MLLIQVCVGSACHMKGSYNVISGLQTIITDKGLDEKVSIRAAFCLGQCTNAVSVKVGNDEEVYSVSESNLKEFFEKNIEKRI